MRRVHGGQSLTTSNCNLLVYDYVLKEGKLPKNTDLGVSKRTISYAVSTLKKAGLIRRIGYGVWQAARKELANNLKGTPLNLITTSKRIRAHAFIVTFYGNNVNKNLSYKENGWKPLNPAFKGYGKQFGDFKVWVSAKGKLTLYANKSYFQSSAKKGRLAALREMREVVEKIEAELGVSWKSKEGYSFRVGREHYADIKNELARDYVRQGKRLEVIEQGKTWLLIDDSFYEGKSKPGELETVENGKAVYDQDKIVSPFFNSLRHNPGFTPDYVNEALVKLTSVAMITQESIKEIEQQIRNIKEG